MRTTIRISDGILSELHERAWKRKRPFREILEKTLQRGLSATPPSLAMIVISTVTLASNGSTYLHEPRDTHPLRHLRPRWTILAPE